MISESTYNFLISVFKTFILFPFIIILLTFIFAGIYAAIYNLNYLRVVMEIFIFYILFIYNIMYVVMKIFSIPVYIINIFLIGIYKIGFILSFIFNIFTYFNTFIYDMTNIEL